MRICAARIYVPCVLIRRNGDGRSKRRRKTKNSPSAISANTFEHLRYNNGTTKCFVRVFTEHGIRDTQAFLKRNSFQTPKLLARKFRTSSRSRHMRRARSYSVCIISRHCVSWCAQGLETFSKTVFVRLQVFRGKNTYPLN